MSSASRQLGSQLASRTKRARSTQVKCGRLTERLSTLSCCRSSRFSVISCGLLRARSPMVPHVEDWEPGLVQRDIAMPTFRNACWAYRSTMMQDNAKHHQGLLPDMQAVSIDCTSRRLYLPCKAGDEGHGVG
jgi:hypothetical protein